MIYRVQLDRGGSESDGYEYYSNYKSAKKRHRIEDFGEIEKRPTPKNKKEMIALLVRWGGHPDND